MLNEYLLIKVFEFLPGNWSILAAVCKKFLAAVENLPKKTYLRNLTTPQLINWARNGPDWKYRLNHKLFNKFSELGNMQMIQYLDAKGYYITPYSLNRAARNGHIEILEHIYKSGCPPNGDFNDNVAISQSREVIQWCINKSLKNCLRVSAITAITSKNWDLLEWICDQDAQLKDLFHVAVLFADISTLERLKKIGFIGEEDLPFYSAASRGDVKLLEWLNDAGYRRTEWTLYAAAETGNISATIWLIEKGTEIHPYAIDIAAERGHFDLVKFLHSQGAKLNETATLCASSSGNIDMLKWILNFGTPIKVKKCLIAAIRHNMPDMVKYLYTLGRPKDSEICEAAAFMGNAEILEFLLSRKCKIGIETFSNAAFSGNLKVIKQLYEAGCEWNSDTLISAASRGHTDILKWAWEHGCPSNDPKIAYFVAMSGNLATLKWMHSIGFKFGTELCSEAARSGHLEIIKWAVSIGYEVNEMAFAFAAKEGYLEMLIWFREQKKFKNFELYHYYAMMGGHKKIMEWVKNQE